VSASIIALPGCRSWAPIQLSNAAIADVAAQLEGDVQSMNLAIVDEQASSPLQRVVDRLGIVVEVAIGVALHNLLGLQLKGDRDLNQPREKEAISEPAPDGSYESLAAVGAGGVRHRRKIESLPPFAHEGR
jgi:hypothetical protein